MNIFNSVLDPYYVMILSKLVFMKETSKIALYVLKEAVLGKVKFTSHKEYYRVFISAVYEASKTPDNLSLVYEILNSIEEQKLLDIDQAVLQSIRRNT